MIAEVLAAASVALTPTSVPTVTADDFTVGREWTWDYLDAKGAVFSTEKYSVVERRGDEVLLEMSSSYDGDPVLTPHHRLRADVSKCLGAHSNPAQKRPWSIRMYSMQNGKWVEFDPMKTLAFEEKFNCNSHVMTAKHAPYLTVFSAVNGEAVFQQKLWRKLTASWFSLDGADRAVALVKEFDSDPSAPYRFVRRP